MPSLAVRGADQFRALAFDFKAAGSPKGLRRKLLQKLRAAAEPMKKGVQANALAIPAKGPASTGLRRAIAGATAIKIRSVGKYPIVRVWVNPDRMPQNQRTLAFYMEGDGVRWRHPVFGPHSDPTWVGQPSHSYFRPAVVQYLPEVQAAAVLAVQEIAAELERG